MPARGCLHREHIDAYLTGDLGEKAMRRVRRHLTGCPKCHAIAEELKEEFEAVSSELVGLLRRPGQGPQYLDEPEFRRALAKVDALRYKLSISSPQQAAGQLAALTAHPDQIGQYQLLESLGQGGMGTVYKALHTKLRRVVVVKVLSSERMDDPGAAARFHREMEAVGRLDHPHIVRATDAGEASGTCFLVMEFVDGIDLSDLVAAYGQLPIADACELIRQAAIGLDHAHQHGMVHRDIKPSNLILSSDGMVKVLDLGLARLRGAPAAHQELTATGQIMGTLDYMAPEQAEDAHSVDIRADIYSLGCTLYKLVTGHAPFSSSKYDTPISKAMAHIQKPPPPISEHRLDVPKGLEEVILRLLAKDPARRYATPNMVAEALLPFTGGRDLLALCSKATGDDLDKFEAPVATSGDTGPAIPARASTHVTPEGRAAVSAPKPPPVPPPRQLKQISASTGAERKRARSSRRRLVVVALLLLIAGSLFLPQVQTWIKSKDDWLNWLSWMQTKPARPNLASAPFSTAEAREHQERWASFLGVPVEKTNSIGMRFVLIPPGEFLMGSPDDEENRYDDEYQHRVRVTKPFYLGVYEVTQDEYQTVMGTNPSNFSSGSSCYPVECVSWEEAVEFCRRLSSLPGEATATRAYRLPTEAEWEYACRAGTTTTYHLGDDLDHEDANVDQGLSLGRTTTAGSYQSNAFGLYDMHGNVWEWCQDWHLYYYYRESPIKDPQGPSQGSLRVRRGGSWDVSPALSRSAVRFGRSPSDREPSQGFRIARTIDLPEHALFEGEEPLDWVSLFDGSDLTGWTPMLSSGEPDDRQPPDGGDWIVRDGVLVCDGAESAWLRSEQEFGDFVLHLEFKLPADANSGVIVRSLEGGYPWIEIQLLGTDYADDPRFGRTAQTGAIFDHVPPTADVQRGADQWNTMQIRCEGDDVQVRMNGMVIVEADLQNVEGLPNPPRTGFIGFLNHTSAKSGSAVGTAFRNIHIRELNVQPYGQPEPGFVSLFDGETLEGWQEPTDGYYVEAGTLVSAEDNRGTLLTTKEYSDFILRFEFQLESGANNGVAIRAPLDGDPSCDGMEIQILDNSSFQDADLDPSKYHGSIFDVERAERGHLKDVGQWNSQEIFCRGRQVRVTLNGAIILDVDLDELGPDARQRCPGIERDKGYLGFIGLRSTGNFPRAKVRFRNVRIRELVPAN
ncbi:MAG: DUF1080 domain-containing protein [Pirellulaceae bacterium]|nr:DUF1080 domain-containing protein [Pirellulaceae bacterium]